MRLKPVPPAPEDLDGLWAARDTQPRVPRSETDCCGRLMDRYGVPERGEAETWLTFMRALGLVGETDGHYYRTGDDPDRAALAERFREGVYAAREVLDALEDREPKSAEATFEAVADVVPEWERHRDPGWEQTWRTRVERLLAWAALFGLVERTAEGYRLTDRAI
ncbi:MAG: hypothetical protein V5A23_03695 [Halobacteriales archaeon]